MPAKIKTVYFQRLLLLAAITEVLSISTAAVAPLHTHICHQETKHEHDSGSSNLPSHDSKHCAVCQMLFGISGKSLIPDIGVVIYRSAVQHITITKFDAAVNIQHIRDITPRAPPAA